MPAEELRHGPVGAFSWLGIAFLTVNSAMAIHRSKGDPSAVGFVAFSYLDLVLLFYFHRRFESAAPGSPARRRLKVAVWVLTTMLTAVLSYKVAAIMPLPVQILVWAMAGAATAGGFYAFFLFREGKARKRMVKEAWHIFAGKALILDPTCSKRSWEKKSKVASSFLLSQVM
uniref:Uncharacterized protein n=1 Tax=Aegilops tauschii TaxID=37682 RepID=R7W739_AEGTA